MPLFGRHHGDGRAAPAAAAAGGAAAAGLPPGWQPVAGQPFSSDTQKAVHELTRMMYGVPRGMPHEGGVGQTTYDSAYRASIDGRVVTAANARTPMDPWLFQGGRKETPAVAVCTAELPSALPFYWIRPRRWPGTTFGEVSAGSPAFRAACLVTGMAAGTLAGMASAGDALTPDVQQRIMARDDWAFWAEPGLLGCVAAGAYRSPAEVTARAGEVLGIIAAIPASVLPRHVDHGADALLRRFAAVDGIEDAIALLQGLTPAEREQLARSDSPLAGFAGVRTPQEAMARFQALDPQSRMQLIVMFTHATG